MPYPPVDLDVYSIPHHNEYLTINEEDFLKRLVGWPRPVFPCGAR